MTKVAVWCRHVGDNVIGIGSQIPWSVPSDVRKFVRIITGQDVVMGRKTYQSLPERDLPADKIFIVSSNQSLELFDKARHFCINDLRAFKDCEEDLYIAGGAKIYEQFICSGDKLMPEVVVDCVYSGAPNPHLEGDVVSITPCIEALNKSYRKIWGGFEKDGVVTDIYIKKGAFVDQVLLRSLVSDITFEDKAQPLI